MATRRGGDGGQSADDLLFTNTEGRRLNGWAWKERVHWAELARGRRVHDVRHTAATLWLSRGVPPKTVQAWLGHSSATLTFDMYSHVLPSSENRSGLDHMNKVLGDTEGGAGPGVNGVVRRRACDQGRRCDDGRSKRAA